MYMNDTTRKFLLGDREPEFSPNCSYSGRRRITDRDHDADADIYTLTRHGDLTIVPVPEDDGWHVEMPEGSQLEVTIEDHRRCNHAGRRYLVKLVRRHLRVGSPDTLSTVTAASFDAKDDSPPLVHKMAFECVLQLPQEITSQSQPTTG